MSFLAITGLVNFLTSTAMAVVVFLKCPQRSLAVTYGLVNASIAVFSFSYMLWQMASTPQSALLPMQMLTVGAMWINQAFLAFTWTFLGMTAFRRRMLWGLLVCNVFFSALTFSGHLFTHVVARRGFGFWPVTTAWFPVYLVFWHAELLGGFVGLVKAFRHAEGRFREQLKYMATAFAIGYLGGITNWPLWLDINIPPYANGLISVYVILVAYAILRYRILDITIIVRRTLIYSIVTAVLTAFYMAVIVVLARAFERLSGSPELWGALLAAFITTLVFHPLRSWVQSFVDRRFFRSRVDREGKLIAFSTEVSRFENLDKMTQSMMRILEEALHPRTVMFFMRSFDGKDYIQMGSAAKKSALPERLPLSNPWSLYFSQDGEPVVRPALGHPLTADMARLDLAVAIPLIRRREVLGFLLLGRKRSDEPYLEEDLVLLRLVVNQATLAYERPKLLQEITGAFVHEIKMPLANIALPAELTFMDIEDVEAGKRRPEDILPKIKRRMKHIMDQAMLAGRKIEAVRQISDSTESKGPVALGAVVGKSLERLGAQIADAGVRIALDSPPGIAPVEADAQQLEIVLTNVMKNAIEAMETLPPGASRELRLRVTQENDDVGLDIRDTGPGIKAEDLPLLFQSNYSTKGAKGAGMGLFLCRQIIEAHGGAIRVQNLKDGALFRLTFPAAVTA